MGAKAEDGACPLHPAPPKGWAEPLSSPPADPWTHPTLSPCEEPAHPRESEQGDLFVLAASCCGREPSKALPELLIWPRSAPVDWGGPGSGLVIAGGPHVPGCALGCALIIRRECLVTLWLMETPVIPRAALPKLGPRSCSKRQPRGGKLGLRGPRWGGGHRGRRQTDRPSGTRGWAPSRRAERQAWRAAGAPTRARPPRPD